MTLPDLAPDPAELDAVELASRDEIEALQGERLRWSLRHAYANVPHYRRAFDAIGFRPEDLREIGELAELPFTRKQDLRAAYPLGMLAVPRTQVLRLHASSGTTGTPTVVGYTRRDLNTWAGLVARSIRVSGGRAGMAVHIAYGYGLFTGGLSAATLTLRRLAPDAWALPRRWPGRRLARAARAPTGWWPGRIRPWPTS